MEALVEEASSALERHSPTSSALEAVRATATTSVAHVRTNGTVVFTHPTTVKNISLLKDEDLKGKHSSQELETIPLEYKLVSGSNSTTQAIAVPQPGGSVSIVHVSIPNQQVHVQSVIQQANQQSVIQAPSGTIQGLSKNVIFVNKGSVIHSADGETGIHPVQLITASKSDSDGETVTGLTPEDESRKRREILARRPSYRKILSELSSTETHTSVGNLNTTSGEIKEDANSSVEETEMGTITVAGTQYHTAAGLLKVVPASAIQLSASGQDGNLQGLQTLTMSNSSAGASIVQYAQGQDGPFFVPVTVSAADLQAAYQIRTGNGNGNGNLSQSVVMTPSNNIQPQHQVVEEASRKREIRLLKNREAAKECRRKKKEYIKCLENRVAVLENQNKALIEELKSLKELYCQKAD